MSHMAKGRPESVPATGCRAWRSSSQRPGSTEGTEACALAGDFLERGFAKATTGWTSESLRTAPHIWHLCRWAGRKCRQRAHRQDSPVLGGGMAAGGEVGAMVLESPRAAEEGRSVVMAVVTLMVGWSRKGSRFCSRTPGGLGLVTKKFSAAWPDGANGPRAGAPTEDRLWIGALTRFIIHEGSEVPRITFRRHPAKPRCECRHSSAAGVPPLLTGPPPSAPPPH